MAIASPSENVYYYECSWGWFRLTYFLPPGELKRLCDRKRISPRVLEDFPDGVDLGCTESDFKDFESDYGFRPALDPSAMRRAFFALFSSTRNWKKFCGSGFISARDLEGHVREVEARLPDLIPTRVAPGKPTREALEIPLEPPALRKYRQTRHRQAVVEQRELTVLRKLEVKGVDKGRTLAEQSFSRIKMEKGAAAEEVFVQLHQRQMRGE